MKKILAIALACVMAFAVMIPCCASPATGWIAHGSYGEYPQSKVTDPITIGEINQVLNSAHGAWQTLDLGYGRYIHYCDVDVCIDKYRVVEEDIGFSYYLFEPLQWHAKRNGPNSFYLVCDTIVSAVPTGTATGSALVQNRLNNFTDFAFTKTEASVLDGSAFIPVDVTLTNNEAADVSEYALRLGMTKTQAPTYLTESSLAAAPGNSIQTEFNGGASGAKGAPAAPKTRNTNTKGGAATSYTGIRPAVVVVYTPQPVIPSTKPGWFISWLLSLLH